MHLILYELENLLSLLGIKAMKQNLFNTADSYLKGKIKIKMFYLRAIMGFCCILRQPYMTRNNPGFTFLMLLGNHASNHVTQKPQLRHSPCSLSVEEKHQVDMLVESPLHRADVVGRDRNGHAVVEVTRLGHVGINNLNDKVLVFKINLIRKQYQN